MRISSCPSTYSSEHSIRMLRWLSHQYIPSGHPVATSRLNFGRSFLILIYVCKGIIIPTSVNVYDTVIDLMFLGQQSCR